MGNAFTSGELPPQLGGWQSLSIVTPRDPDFVKSQADGGDVSDGHLQPTIASKTPTASTNAEPENVRMTLLVVPVHCPFRTFHGRSGPTGCRPLASWAASTRLQVTPHRSKLALRDRQLQMILSLFVDRRDPLEDLACRRECALGGEILAKQVPGGAQEERYVCCQHLFPPVWTVRPLPGDRLELANGS